MSSELLRIYDEGRNFADKAFKSACYAPFSSLYFDQLGFVRVCCQNYQHSLGNVTRTSLDDIWKGARAQALRDALRAYNFELGCQYCLWQVLDGNFNNFARQFDRWPVTSSDQMWPAQMEFSISNTCNLECIMCNGEWSSSIRTRREKLPPIPKVYTDSFFNDLRKFLPHLQAIKILGGEPFLAHESYRIWDMLIEDGLRVPCHVTTNGTHYNAKIEHVLAHLPFSFSISMDGATKETVERVRVNAKYETLMENFKRFHAYAREKGTSIGLTYCLLPVNWHEFGDYLLFADEWDVDVTANTVLHPPQYSLWDMTAAQLRPIVEGMEAQEKRILPQLKRNRAVWINELDRLRHRMLHADEDRLSFIPGKLIDLPTASLPIVDEANLREDATQSLQKWGQGSSIGGLICDAADNIVDTVDQSPEFLSAPRDQCLGRPFDQIYPLLRMRFGGMSAVHREKRGEFIERTFGFTGFDLAERTMRMITFPRRENGQPLGSVTLATIIDAPYEVAKTTN